MERKEFVGYPQYCYVRSPNTGLMCKLYPGENTLYGTRETDRGVPSRELQHTMRDEQWKTALREANAEIGVSAAQQAAMVAGFTYGWEHPSADPMAYNAAGKYLKGA